MFRFIIACCLALLPLDAACAKGFRVYAFSGGSDGAYPIAWIADEAGNLYGTTYLGGAFGSGTVFKVGQDGKETVLHSFCGKRRRISPSQA